jgi:hypothetical protein
MKPNKKERRQIYLKAKDIYIKQTNLFARFCLSVNIPTPGLCCCIACAYADHSKIEITSIKYSHLLDLFPEFKAIKPKGKTIGEFWFENKKQRINAFNKMIQETA